MSKKITFIFLSAIITFYPIFLFAAGTTTADFLNLSPGARPSGMGEAFVSVADETSGMYYNPAGPAYMMSPELQTMYAALPGDLYYGLLGYVHPTLNGTYGLGFQYLSGASIPKFAAGVSQGGLNYYDLATTLHYSVHMDETSTIGFNLKMINDSLDTDSSSTLTGDLGLLFRTPGESFSFGVAGQNLFGSLGGDKLPLTGRAGFSLKSSVPGDFSEVLFSMEAGLVQGEPGYVAAGLEHWGAGTLGLRVGYKYSLDDKQRSSFDPLSAWRAGISLRFSSVSVDYAYQPLDALGLAQRLSVSWRMFGWQTKYLMVPARIRAEPNIFSPNGDGAKDSAFFIPEVPEIKNVKKWELDIDDISHNPIKKFSGKDLLPKILSWEGQTDNDRTLLEGKYYFQFRAEGDGKKKAESDFGELIVDFTPPAASLVLSKDEISPNGDGINDLVTLNVSVSDAYGIDQWMISVINDRGKTVHVIKSTESAPTSVDWNGEDDFYNKPVPNGAYEVRLIAWDVAGNKTKAASPLKVNVAPKVEVKEVVKEIEVKSDARGLKVNLSSNVMFEQGKSRLRPQAFKPLDEVANLLETYPENEVSIEGHTDATGNRKTNMELSGDRAWAVYSYLVKHGVSPARLKVKGFGPDKPIASNKTELGRAQNRRVEIIILKAQTTEAPAPR
jgi:outer membrane protein OmpA-like peptidoglycan-associated protein